MIYIYTTIILDQFRVYKMNFSKLLMSILVFCLMQGKYSRAQNAYEEIHQGFLLINWLIILTQRQIISVYCLKVYMYKVNTCKVSWSLAVRTKCTKRSPQWSCSCPGPTTRGPTSCAPYPAWSSGTQATSWWNERNWQLNSKEGTSHVDVFL